VRRPIDPDIAAAVAFGRRMSRRRFIAGTGAGLGAAVLAPSLLGACSQPTDKFTFSNWVAYIDEDDNGNARGKGTTLYEFERQTGLKINYLTDFNDNDEYFNRSFSPMLGRGKPISADIVAPTNWMAARLISLGWTEKLLLDRIPNHKNIEDAYLDLPWDPGATSFMPWQAGIGGIAYDAGVTGRELKSANDLFDPEFKGKIAMLTEMRDSVGLTMFGLGSDPASAKPDDVHAALDKIEEARNNGQILKFTGNEYLQDLSRGELAACVAWSGDIYSLESDRDIRFIVPEEGGTQWFDTMVVPKGAQRPEDAAAWMNFVYDPENAARITEWVGYISPVKGVREVLEAAGGDSAAVAEEPLVFPDDDTQSRLRVFGPLDQKDEIEIQTRFNDLTG
jgi:spermidine/putrescine transport system substrate-binding protein